MEFTKKYSDLIISKNRLDVLEGTTHSGKTTVGAGVKFMLECAASTKRFHGIAAADLGTAEKNIINAEHGILNEWGDYVSYYPKGLGVIRFPHLVLRLENGDTKIIYVFGYDDSTRWKKILGGQLGCLYIDEANIAHIDFIREAAIRNDYMLWTLNPDDPNLPIYDEYINHCRPQEGYNSDYPAELLEQLNKEPRAGWAHWYFTFDHNIGCTPEKRQQIIDNAPVGTKLHKNKVLGLRGVGGGALYAGYMDESLIIPYHKINADSLAEIICAVDMGSYTGQSDKGDKKARTIATVTGYSQGYQRVVVLEAKQIDSNDIDFVVDEVDKLLAPYWANYYTRLTKIVIDYGDSGDLLIRTWRKRSRLKGVAVKGCVKTGKINGTPKAINLQSRAQLKVQLLMGQFMLWTTRSVESYKAHYNIMSTPDGKELETGREINDYADSLTYTLTEKWVKVSNLTKGAI